MDRLAKSASIMYSINERDRSRHFRLGAMSEPAHVMLDMDGRNGAHQLG